MTEQQKSKQIEPTHVEEPWTIIHLPDGDKIKCKHVVIGVMQMLNEDGTPKLLEDGATRMYGVVHSQPTVGLLPKEEQRKLS